MEKIINDWCDLNTTTLRFSGEKKTTFLPEDAFLETDVSLSVSGAIYCILSRTTSIMTCLARFVGNDEDIERPCDEALAELIGQVQGNLTELKTLARIWNEVDRKTYNYVLEKPISEGINIGEYFKMKQ